MTDTQRAWLLTVSVLLAAAALLVPDVAFAQLSGGGSGGNPGLLSPIVQWFQQNLLGGIILIGVIAIGIILCFMRFYIGAAAMMVIGALIADHAQQIAALL